MDGVPLGIGSRGEAARWEPLRLIPKIHLMGGGWPPVGDLEQWSAETHFRKKKLPNGNKKKRKNHAKTCKKQPKMCFKKWKKKFLKMRKNVLILGKI